MNIQQYRESYNLLKEIEAAVVHGSGKIEEHLPSDRIKMLYSNEKIEYNNKTYSYSIYWIGLDNDVDEGSWSAPFDIEEVTQ